MGLSVKDIAKDKGIVVQSVYEMLQAIKKKGYSLENADFKDFKARNGGQQLNIEV
jgi:transposase